MAFVSALVVEADAAPMAAWHEPLHRPQTFDNGWIASALTGATSIVCVGNPELVNLSFNTYF